MSSCASTVASTSTSSVASCDVAAGVQFTSSQPCPQQNTVLKKPVAVYPKHSQYFRHHQTERSSDVLSRSRSRSHSEGHISEVKVVMEEEEILEYERVGLSMEKIACKNDESIENSDSGMEDTKTYGLSDDAHSRGKSLPPNGQFPGLTKPVYYSRSSNNNNNACHRDSNGNAEIAEEESSSSSPPNVRRPLAKKERYESKDTLYSSSGELSSVATSSTNSLLAVTTQNLRQPARASTESILSCEEDRSGSQKKPALDFDIGSSMESLGTNPAHYSKMYGMSLYDEIQLADQLGEQYIVMEDGTVMVLVEEETQEGEDREGEQGEEDFDGNDTLSNRQELEQWDESHEQSSESQDEEFSGSPDRSHGVLDHTLESLDHIYAAPNGSHDHINEPATENHNGAHSSREGEESHDESEESGEESSNESEESERQSEGSDDQCDEAQDEDDESSEQAEEPNEQSSDHVKESHDLTKESCDPVPELHDKSTSPDHTAGSHDHTTGSHDHTSGSYDQTVLHVEASVDPSQSANTSSSTSTSENSCEPGPEDELNQTKDVIDAQYHEFSRTSFPAQMSYTDHDIPIIHQTIPETSYDDNVLDVSQSDESLMKAGSSSAASTSEEQEVYIIMESYTMADGHLPSSESMAQIMSEGAMVGIQTENGIQMMSYEDMAKMASSMGDMPYEIIMVEMPDDANTSGTANFSGAQVIELSDSEAELDLPKNAIRMKQPDGSEIIVIQEDSQTEDSASVSEDVKHAPKKEDTEGLLSESFQSSNAESLKAQGCFYEKGMDEAAAINDSIKATIKEKLGIGGASTTSETSEPSSDPKPFAEAAGEQKRVMIKELTEEEAQALAAAGIPASKSTDKRHSMGSDELLSLLDKIDRKAVETRTELKMAYVRETYLQGELEADEEHINNIVEDLNKEIETLRSENKKFYSEMTQHRTANKAYKLKITKLESVVDRLHNHTEELERQIFEVTTSSNQKPISVTVGSMTDKSLLMANAKSVGILTDYVQKIGPIVKDAASLVHPHQSDSLTMTDPIVQALQCEVACQTVPDLLCYDQGVQVGCGKMLRTCPTQTENIPPKSVSLADGCTETEIAVSHSMQQTSTEQHDKSTNTETDSKTSNHLKMSPNKGSCPNATDLMDNSELLGKKPETPDKWRRLAMTPFNSDPVTLQLQRSLATATVEYDITQAKLKKNAKEAGKRAEELEANLSKTQELLQKAKESSEAAHARWQGDRVEVDNLRDRITNLERQLSAAHTHNQQLEQKVQNTLAEATRKEDIMTQAETSTEDIMTQTQEDVVAKEDEDMNKTLVEEEDPRKVESKPELQDPEKEQLKTEVQVLREEFKHVQKGVEIIETLLRGPAPKPSEAKVLNQRLSDLKAHVLACQTGDQVALGIQPIKNNDAKSLHEDIMKQSENVLHILHENGAIPEHLELEGPSINWAEVQKSIEKQLSKETAQKLSVSVSGANIPEAQASTMPLENRTSKELPQSVSQLAEAIEQEIGMKVNIVIEPVPAAAANLTPQSQEEDVITQTLGKKYKLDHDKMNKEYEELRKKRLAMIVQAYTGKTEMPLKDVTSPQIQEKLVEGKELSEVEKIIVNHLGESALLPQNSAETSAARERLRTMREQLNKKDQALKEEGLLKGAELNITHREKTSTSMHQTPPQKKRELPERPTQKPKAKPALSEISQTSKRQIYPHKKDYVPAAKYYQMNSEEESGNTDAGPVSGEDLESLMSDTDRLSEVSDPRATSLYQRTYSKGTKSPPTKRKSRSNSPAHKALSAGSPITQSFHHIPSGHKHDEFEATEGNRMSMSLTELNFSQERLDGAAGKVGLRSLGSLQDKYRENHDFHGRGDDMRYERDKDGYYSSSTKLATGKSADEKRRDWTQEVYNGRETMDSVFSDAYDKLDSCGCSHKDLRCTHLDLHKQPVSYSNYKSIPAKGFYNDKPKQENIVGGLPLRDEQYASRSKLHGPKSTERSGSQGSRERSYESRERSHDMRERSHDSRERSPDSREIYDSRERSNDREKTHSKERAYGSRESSHHLRDRSPDYRERSHDSKERSYDSRLGFRDRAHDSRDAAYDTRERSHDRNERPYRSQRSHDTSPKRSLEERPPIPSEKDYEELRSQIRRIFSESTLDKDTPVDYDSVTGSPRYKSHDTLYRDTKRHSEKPRDADRYPTTPELRRKNAPSRDDHYSAYDQPYSTPRSRTRDDREKYPPRTDDTKPTKQQRDDGESYTLRPRSVGNSSYTPLRDEKYNLRPRSVEKSGYADDVDETHNIRPRSVGHDIPPSPGKSPSVASSETDFVVLGSGEIVNRKAKGNRPTLAELEEPKWTEPKRRFLPPTESMKAPETYWKEPKRYANEGAGYAKDTNKPAEKWGSRNMERRRDGDGKEVSGSSWYSGDDPGRTTPAMDYTAQQEACHSYDEESITYEEMSTNGYHADDQRFPSNDQERYHDERYYRPDTTDKYYMGSDTMHRGTDGADSVRYARQERELNHGGYELDRDGKQQRESNTVKSVTPVEADLYGKSENRYCSDHRQGSKYCDKPVPEESKYSKDSRESVVDRRDIVSGADKRDTEEKYSARSVSNHDVRSTSKDTYDSKETKLKPNDRSVEDIVSKYEKMSEGLKATYMVKGLDGFDKMDSNGVNKLDPDTRKRLANEIINKYTEELDRTVKDKAMEFQMNSNNTDSKVATKDGSENGEKSQKVDVDKILQKYSEDGRGHVDGTREIRENRESCKTIS